VTEQKQDFTDALVQSVKDLGLIFPLQPTLAEHEQKDVTQLTPTELMTRMEYWTAQTEYARVEVAKASSDTAAAKARYRRERTVRYLAAKEGRVDPVTKKKIPIKDIEYALDSAPDLDKLLGVATAAEQREKLISAILENYVARYNLLSRELTRRSNRGSDH
jgi:hypothetical protein